MTSQSYPAATKLASADEKYRRRLHFTRCGFEFTQLVVSTRAAMQKFEAGKGKDAAAKAQVLANWARVDVMEKEYPAFAINWHSVFAIGTPGGRNKRTEGLHPDAPLSPRTLKEMSSTNLE